MTLSKISIAALAIATFLLGLFAGFAINSDYLPISELLAAAVTLVAAYAGAAYAFRLQNKRLQQEKLEKQVAAANRAIYTIFDIWNVLKQYQKEVIEVVRDKSGTWFEMSATIPGMHEEIKFDTGYLDFLLGSNSPNMYADLLVEEKRYKIAITLINERSGLMLNKVYPKIDALGIPKGSRMDLKDIEHALGPDLSTKLQTLTTSIITNIDEDIASLVKKYEKFQGVLNQIFPNEKFIKVEFTKPCETGTKHS